jgi:hypothetical protein
MGDMKKMHRLEIVYGYATKINKGSFPVTWEGVEKASSLGPDTDKFV